jgi:soluble P-type ATPase
LIERVTRVVELHVVTADTFSMAEKCLSGLPVRLTILPEDNQDEAKADYIRQLGRGTVACLGNGRNDRLMLREAALGICLVQAEGAAVRTLQDADVVCTSAGDALELFLNPKRLVATLRR